MVHIVYIVIICLVFLFALGWGRAYEQKKNVAIVQAKEAVIKKLLADIVLNTEQLKDSNDIHAQNRVAIARLEQRNAYLENLVKAMMLDTGSV